MHLFIIGLRWSCVHIRRATRLPPEDGASVAEEDADGGCGNCRREREDSRFDLSLEPAHFLASAICLRRPPPVCSQPPS